MVALDYPSDRWRWDRPEKRSRTTDVSGNGPKRLIQLKRIYFGLETGRHKGGRNGASGVGAVDSRGTGWQRDVSWLNVWPEESD
jgi:hypothetical protein